MARKCKFRFRSCDTPAQVRISCFEKDHFELDDCPTPILGSGVRGQAEAVFTDDPDVATSPERKMKEREKEREGDRERPTPYSLHPTPYTLHPTPYPVHLTPYTLSLTPDPKMGVGQLSSSK